MKQDLPIAEDWFTIEPADEYGVRRIREHHVNERVTGSMWFVEGSERCLMVETGLGVAPVRRFLETITEKPIIAFASVGYYDHAGGLYQFDERLIHGADAWRVSKPTRHNTVAETYLGDTFTVLPYKAFDPMTYVMPASEATRSLVGGDKIDLGDRVFDVLHLPGVTAGASALFERESGALFTGEAFVWVGDYVYDGEPSNISDDADRAAFRKSIRGLCDLPVTTVYPGHLARRGADEMKTAIAAYLDGRSVTRETSPS